MGAGWREAGAGDRVFSRRGAAFREEPGKSAAGEERRRALGRRRGRGLSLRLLLSALHYHGLWCELGEEGDPF